MTPQGRLTETAEIAAGLDWRKFKADLSLFTADGYPTGGDGTGRSSSIPDPTYVAAMARKPHADTVAQCEDLIHIAHDAIRNLASRMASLAPTAVDIAAVKRAARCSDPLCDELGARDGLCWRHYHEMRRAG